MAMQEPTYLILTALADERRHGYGVLVEVRRISDGRVDLRPGTLYTALDRLCAQGLVGRAGEEIVDGRRRQYYALTDAGARELDEESQRLRSRASEASRRLRLRGAPA
jgi:DNA-binding PadR family transcriptional regulator